MFTLCTNEEKRALLKPVNKSWRRRHAKPICISLIILFVLTLIIAVFVIIRFQSFPPSSSILLTASPTIEPTVEPTTFPTVNPTKPTLSPTLNPTLSPTKSPTTSPTLSPTMNPTRSPSMNPTISPTLSPTHSLPIPGELTNITTNITITVNETVSYLQSGVVLECKMNVNDNGDLLKTSYIIISASFYNNNVQNKTYLIASSKIYQSLPLQCQQFLALKIMDSEKIEINNELYQKLYVTEAVLTEYLNTMDVDISNLTLHEQPGSPIIVNPPNTINGTVVNSAIFPVNCSKNECGGIYGDGFDGELKGKYNLNGITRRRLRKFGVGLSIDPNVKVAISSQKYGVSVNFSLESGIDFYAGIYAIFKCKFSIFSGFNYFKFVIGLESHFKAYMNLNINGALSLDLKIIEKKKALFFWLGPIPVFVRFYGKLYVGYNSANIPIQLSLEAGYNRVFYEWGFEYRKSSGWHEIENFSKFQLMKTFGGTVGEKHCFWVNVEPWIELKIGMVFYEIIDIYARFAVTANTELKLPGTCDASRSECDYPVTQLRFDINVDFETYIGLEVYSILFFDSYQWELRLLHLPIWSWQHCINFQIPFLEDSCCRMQPETPAPTQKLIDIADNKMSCSSSLLLFALFVFVL